jgi:hypothetical protein
LRCAGCINITLYQERYSLSSGLLEGPVGDLTIPLSSVNISPDDGPCHTNVQWYPVSNFKRECCFASS